MSLQTLDLSFNGIRAAGCVALAARALGKAGCLLSLQTLDLSYNDIGAAGCVALAEHALGKAGCLMSLQTLHLSNNGIGDEGCAALAERALDMPECLSSLQYLGLDINRISKDELARIMELVQSRRASLPDIHHSHRHHLRSTRSPSSVQLAMRHWRKASKTRRKTLPWRQRQRLPTLSQRARLQHETHGLCDSLLVLGDWEGGAVHVGDEGASRLRHHGMLSVVEAQAAGTSG
jgi:Ran GTPase-activating protein (RanGAP) involved in mRNA processing and transport